MVIFRIFCYFGGFLFWWVFWVLINFGFCEFGYFGFCGFLVLVFSVFCFSLLNFGFSVWVCGVWVVIRRKLGGFVVFYFGLGLILLLILVGWLEVGITNLLWLFVWICCFVFFGCLVWGVYFQNVYLICGLVVVWGELVTFVMFVVWFYYWFVALFRL